MIYHNRHICIKKWLLFCQGFVLNSKRIILTPVKRRSDGCVHIPYTCDLIQHEEQHCKDIERKGWIDFFSTEGWQLLWKKHDAAAYEPDAEKAELLPNSAELEQLVINYCKQNNILSFFVHPLCNFCTLLRNCLMSV